jgi:hypothetical protein
MKLRFAISGLALLATSHLANATTIQFDGSKESQGLGGADLQGSFTFDLSTATVVLKKPFNAVLYLTSPNSSWQYTTGSISAHDTGPLSVLISAGTDPTDDQQLIITTYDILGVGLSEPQLSLNLLQIGPGPHDLIGTGAPTSLDLHDWGDRLIKAYTGTLPQELVGQYSADALSVASMSVDEPGSLPVFAMGLLALLGLSHLRREVGAKPGAGVRTTATAC